MIPQKAKPKTFVTLTPGDPAPWFHQRCGSNPNYAFDTVGGRWVVLCFYGTAADEDGRRALAAIAANRALFDDNNASFFGVSLDPNDEAQGRVADSMPGLRFFWDFDGTASRLYGAVPKDTDRFYTIEGNNNNAVVLSERTWSTVDFVGRAE